MNSRRSLLFMCCALFGAFTGCSSPPQIPEKGESVILVHGLGRSSSSMKVLASRVEEAGYRVINFGYPSTSEPIEALTERLGAEAPAHLCCTRPRGDLQWGADGAGKEVVGATGRHQGGRGAAVLR